MKGGNIYNSSYEEKAIEYIKESMDVNEPLNQKSQAWYGKQRAKYLKYAVSELNKKIYILNEYSKEWSKGLFGNTMNENTNENNNNKKNNKNNNKNNSSMNHSKNSSSNSTKKNHKSVNYNANDENMKGGSRYRRKHKRVLRKTRKYYS